MCRQLIPADFLIRNLARVHVVKLLFSTGFIPYTLGVSPLSDMKLIGNRIPEKIVIPVDISDIYFSVKTASIFPERLNIIMLTWAQTVPIDQVIGINVIIVSIIIMLDHIYN